MSIDVAISADRNVNKKGAEKILIYEYLKIGIQCMWNVKAKVIPVNNRATGTISESPNQYLSTKSRNYRNQPYCALHTNCGQC